MTRKKNRFGGDFTIKNIRQLPNQHDKASGVTVAPTFLNNTAGWTLRFRGAAAAGHGSEIAILPAPVNPPIPLDELLFAYGTFNGSIDVGGETLTSGDSGTQLNGYVSRWKTDGTVQWVAPVISDSQIQPFGFTSNSVTGDSYAVFIVQINGTDSSTITVKNGDGTTGATVTGWNGVTTANYYEGTLVVGYNFDGDVQYAKIAVDHGPDQENAAVASARIVDDVVFNVENDTLQVVEIAWPTTLAFNETSYGADIRHTWGWGETGPSAALAWERGSQNPSIFKLDASTGDYVTNSIKGFYGKNDGQGGSSKISTYHFQRPIPNVFGGRTTPAGLTGIIVTNTAASSVIYNDDGDADPILLSAANQQCLRFGTRGTDGTHIDMVTGYGVIAPSEVMAGTQDLPHGTFMIPVDGENFLIAFQYAPGATTDQIIWTADGSTFFTKETTDTKSTTAPIDSVIVLAYFTSTFSSKVWSRVIDREASSLTYPLESVVVDEANNAIYLASVHHGELHEFHPEWDGSTVGAAYQTLVGLERGFMIIKLDLDTGATLWWAYVDGADSNVDRPSLAVTDDHLVATFTQEQSISTTYAGALLHNSNLDGHRAAAYIDAVENTTNAESTHLVLYSKAKGQVESTSLISSGSVSTTRASGIAHIPYREAVATEPAAPATAELIPGTPVFGAESVAISTFGASPTTTLFAGDGDDTNVWNRGLSVGGNTTHGGSATGGPGGGGTNASNVLANLSYFYNTAATTTGAYYEASAVATLVQPGIVLICAYADNLTNDMCLLSSKIASNEWEIRLNNSGYLELDAGTTLTATGTAITAGTWFWVAVKVDGASSEIVCSVAQSASGAAGAQDLREPRLFKTSANTLSWVGRANAIKIWSGTSEWAAVQAYAAARWDEL